jgi:hypothetical protein
MNQKYQSRISNIKPKDVDVLLEQYRAKNNKKKIILDTVEEDLMDKDLSKNFILLTEKKQLKELASILNKNRNV